jgi:hypothetical protein
MTYTPHPLRVQRRRTKGWEMPDGAIYVGRPTMFGNPFDDAEDFESWLMLNAEQKALGLHCNEEVAAMLDVLPLLKGKQLACWCSLDKPCHADVLAEWANR